MPTAAGTAPRKRVQQAAGPPGLAQEPTPAQVQKLAPWVRMGLDWESELPSDKDCREIRAGLKFDWV